jgi:hypothetical protein
MGERGEFHPTLYGLPPQRLPNGLLDRVEFLGGEAVQF